MIEAVNIDISCSMSSGSPRGAAPALAEPGPILDHYREVGLDRAGREERGQQLPLPPPQCARAGHQPIAQQQLADRVVALALGINVALLHGDAPDMVGMHNHDNVLRADLDACQIAVAAPGRFEEAKHALALDLKRDVERNAAATVRN
jgi:hypothetical protein